MYTRGVAMVIIGGSRERNEVHFKFNIYYEEVTVRFIFKFMFQQREKRNNKPD